jgi:hypothetical protein
VAGFAELVTRVAEKQIRSPHQLVKQIQLPARLFHPFQRFGNGADRFHRRVVEAVGAPA